MYQPNYQISERLLSSIVKFEVDKALMEAADVQAAIRTKQRADSKAHNLFHLAHLIGVNITLKDAEKLADGRKLALEGPRATVLNNFRNIIEFNRSNVADSYIELDATLMLHLNKLLLANWKEPWDVKFRTVGEEIDPNMDPWVGAMGEESTELDIQAELQALNDWFKMSGARVHPLIRVGVMVYRLAELMPFTAANKLTVVALTDFFLTRYGYTENTYLPVTRTFDIYAEEYLEAWEICRKNFDLTLWLERFIRNMSKDLGETKTEVDKTLAEEKEKNTKQPFLDLNKRQLKILKYLQTIPTVKREDYCQMMDVSTMTAYRDLDDLVNKKLLKVDGRGRGTKYMLVSR